MALLPTIPQTVNIGKATIFLMSNDFAKGAIFQPTLLKESSSVLIAYTTAAIEWQYDSVPDTDTLRGTANYLLWLCGRYRLEASGYTGGGGSVIPITPGGQTKFPFWIFSSDFEDDGVTVLDPRFEGANVALFINEFSQQWLGAGLGYFVYVDGGIRITIPLFDANTQDYTIMVQQVFGNSAPSPSYPFIFDSTFSDVFN